MWALSRDCVIARAWYAGVQRAAIQVLQLAGLAAQRSELSVCGQRACASGVGECVCSERAHERVGRGAAKRCEVN